MFISIIVSWNFWNSWKNFIPFSVIIKIYLLLLLTDLIRSASINFWQLFLTVLYDRFAFWDILDIKMPSIPACIQAWRISLVIANEPLFCCFKKDLIVDVVMLISNRYFLSWNFLFDIYPDAHDIDVTSLQTLNHIVHRCVAWLVCILHTRNIL